jgi:hypothetical protein
VTTRLSLTFTYISHPLLFASLKISMLLPYNPSPTYFTLSPIFSLNPLSHDKNIFLSSPYELSTLTPKIILLPSLSPKTKTTLQCAFTFFLNLPRYHPIKQYEP